MKIITLILRELKTPDDQGRDWYAWASNQMAHVLIGLTIAGLVAVTLNDLFLAGWVVLSFAVVKEMIDDICHGSTMGDSLQDIIFQLIGALLAVALYSNIQDLAYAAVSFGAVSLIAGIWPRARRALKAESEQQKTLTTKKRPF